MADLKKPTRDPIAALLDFAVGVEQTPEEAQKELREMGVDVAAFLARIRERTSAPPAAAPPPSETFAFHDAELDLLGAGSLF